MRNRFIKAISLFAVLALLPSCQNVSESQYVVDVQAHRGGMGLRPANTLEAMKHAIDLGVNTLEMDIVVTKDNKVILCHDKYFTWQENSS